jgi:hypothetical protein
MKKLYTLIALIGLSTFVFGQTYLSEDFSSNQMPPAGWTIDDQAAQWSIANSNTAGGVAPEAKFHWVQGIATSRLISPEIDMTGISTVTFSFNHYLDDYNHTDYSLGVATTSGGSGVWTDVWTLIPTGDVGPEMVSFDINNADLGQPGFQICLYFDGNMYNLNDWFIDDIILFTPFNLDAEMVSLNNLPFTGGPMEITGTVRNFGSTQINSLDIDWEVDGEAHTTTFDGLSLDFGDTYDFTCADLFDFPVGTYTVVVTITSVNGTTDDNPDNNQLSTTISVMSNAVYKKPCFEEFTSSTCGPCAGFNSQFSPWTTEHDEAITLIKYQMDWPGSGDPYYTEEGGVRKSFYGVTGVPSLYTNGSFTGSPGYVPTLAQVIEAYDNAITEPGLLSLVGSHTLNGTIMDITTTILPYASFSDVSVYIVVFEYITTQNVGSNGETQFEHVMMKMVPDAYGTSTDLVDRQPFTISESVDLDGTNVEEWDDLGVAIFIQDMGNKEIYQSEYSVENATYATEARLSSILVDGEEIPDFDPDTYSYDIALAPGTVEVPVVEAVLMDVNGSKIIIPANEIPGMTTIDTYGEDLATHLTYEVNFSIATGVGNEAFEAVKVYPNPTNGKLFFRGTEGADVKVYSVTGSLVADVKDFSNNSIDLSGMQPGIYYVSIILEDKTVVTKKISLLK